MEPLRISVLCQMAKSPMHAKWALDNESKPSRTMDVGSLAHAILLGKEPGVTYPGKVRRGKDFEVFAAQYPEGTKIFLESELVESRGIARAIQNHDEASSLLLGIREETVLWDFAGRPCRGTPDVFNPATSTLVDVKSTADASPRAFRFTALRLAYHAKKAWYADGLAAAKRANIKRVFIIAAENKAPYAVCVYQLTPAALDFGRRLYSDWLNRFLVHEQSNYWPGYLPEQLDSPEDLELDFGGETVEVA